MNMVLGFVFSADKRSVLLIRKNRPLWQAGKFNGIGGKLEPGETALQAMVREFLEETGVETYPFDWKPFCSFGGLGTYGPFHIECYSCVSEDYFQNARSVTDEEVARVSIYTVFQDGFPALDKLKWMVSLALDENCTAVIEYRVQA